MEKLWLEASLLKSSCLFGCMMDHHERSLEPKTAKPRRAVRERPFRRGREVGQWFFSLRPN